MHLEDLDYISFQLYQPATLYVAIDEQACNLPSWMSDWAPTDDIIETSDIPLKLYKRAFPIGDVTLGGNWMEPASCIRSHYLLFVVE